MNPATYEEAKKLFNATKKIATKNKDVHVVVAPPVIFLGDLAKGYRGSHIVFAAQNIFWEKEGSYTGEVSAAQVRDTGAQYVIIGHAERRKLGVSNEQVGKKVAAALEQSLRPIIAVGELERDTQGDYIQAIREQIVTALRDVSENKLKYITIAYEPVWAIGATQAPARDGVHQMMLLVRKILREEYGERVMKQMRVLYGGSVNDTNAFDILGVPDLSGVLLGRASLDPEQLEVVVRAAQTAAQ